MCGLAGIVSEEPSAGLAGAAGRMLRAAAHRGPDGAGIEAFLGGDRAAEGQPAAVVLGCCRLAIQDPSPRGRQPMADPAGRFWIAFNGEIYNFVELRAELEREGDRFESRTDTEVLLRLWARHGPACLPRLDGMFALLALDMECRTLTAVRDRFGIKPLYVQRLPGEMRFASEIKQLAAAPGWRAGLNGPRAFDFLARGLIDHTAQTLFDGVEQVPPGTILEVAIDRPGLPATTTRWYEIRAAGRSGPPSSWAPRFARGLAASVRRHLRADAEIGSCLSGGLDSSSIVCLAGECRGRGARQEIFTARSGPPGPGAPDEWPWAKTVARYAGARPVAVTVDGGELLERLGDLVRVHDEPFGSPSIFAQFKVFEAAAGRGIRVMLDGQGADEYLAGYHVFFAVRLLELLRGGDLAGVLTTARQVRAVHGVTPGRLAAGAAACWLPAALERILPGGLAGAAPRGILDPERFGAPPADPFRAMTGRRRGVRAFSIDLLAAASLPMLLHWEDRNAMAHGVEARVPFLAHRLVEFALALPASAKLDGATTKVLLRSAMAGRIPQRVRRRTDKVAFATPEARWLCRDHRAAARRAIDRALEAGGRLFPPSAAAALRGMIEGERPYDAIAWRVLCFGEWLDRFAVATGGR